MGGRPLGARLPRVRSQSHRTDNAQSETECRECEGVDQWDILGVHRRIVPEDGVNPCGMH